jgi:hypothetical protein
MALAANLFGLKVPTPPVQLPPVAAIAASVTALAPQLNLSAPAFAVTADFIVIVISSAVDGQAPLPGVFHVSVTSASTSPATGV